MTLFSFLKLEKLRVGAGSELIGEPDPQHGTKKTCEERCSSRSANSCVAETFATAAGFNNWSYFW